MNLEATLRLLSRYSAEHARLQAQMPRMEEKIELARRATGALSQAHKETRVVRRGLATVAANQRLIREHTDSLHTDRRPPRIRGRGRSRGARCGAVRISGSRRSRSTTSTSRDGPEGGSDEPPGGRLDLNGAFS
jgi:hypothetical protein